MPEFSFLRGLFGYKKAVKESASNQPKTVEIQIDEAFQKKAQEILAELEQKEGKKGLVMIVEDSPRKVVRLLENVGFGEHLSQYPNLGYVISVHDTGREAIGVYGALRTLEADERHSVIILMDGTLEMVEGERERRRIGVEVAREVVRISDSNAWPRPYFIGESNDDLANVALQRKFPDLYLGTINPESFLGRQPNIFKAIESKFK